MIHGAYSLNACLTTSNCSSSVKYSSVMTSPLPALKTQQDAQAFTDLADWALLLRRLLAQGLHGNDAPRHFIFPEENCELRAALVRTLQLRLETPAAEIDLQCEIRPGVAQSLGQLEARDLRAFPGQHQIDVRPVALPAQSLLLEKHDDPLLPHGPADPRRAGAAQLGHQAVVSSPRTDRALRPECVRRPLENRAGVVVEPAHQMRFDMILDAGAAQLRAQRLEVRARLRIEEIEQPRRSGDDALHVRILAVEYAQRIALQPTLAVLIERGLMGTEIGRELHAIGRARCRGAERIPQQLRAGQAEPPQQAGGKQNDLGIDIRALKSECLCVDLMELAVAPRLRPLAPEHGSHAPHAQAALAQQAVRDDCARDAGSRFGAQRDVVLALIDEAEHLLLDDVGKVADRAFEQLRLLDHGNAEFLVTIGCEDLARDLLQMLPGRDLRGQHVVYAAQGLDDLAQELKLRSADWVHGGGRRTARRRPRRRRAGGVA